MPINTTIHTRSASDTDRLYWLARRWFKAERWRAVAQAQMDAIDHLRLSHPLCEERTEHLGRLDDLMGFIENVVIGLVMDTVGPMPRVKQVGDYVFAVAINRDNPPLPGSEWSGATIREYDLRATIGVLDPATAAAAPTVAGA
jgi:hypothetical protein